MVRAYFSIGEAEALLPSLSSLVEKARDLKVSLDREERVSVRQTLMTDGSTELSDFGESYDGQLNSLKESFYEAVEKIESMGAVLRDVEKGLVGFYTHFEGRDVLLCWRLGERRIRFWQELDEGARKRILEFR